MSEVPAKTVKKLQTLAQIATDLRQGEHFNITRLTMLKSLCSDPEAAAKFAVHLASRTQKRMKSESCPSHIKPDTWKQYQQLASKAVRGMTKHLKEESHETKSLLRDLLIVIRDAQGKFVRQQWGPVRIIESNELLMVEKALECVLHPWASADLGYRLARQYAERYNSHHGTGLIPESAPMVQDIADFWGRLFLGRGWRKQLKK
jgi:hypothetical protein